MRCESLDIADQKFDSKGKMKMMSEGNEVTDFHNISLLLPELAGLLLSVMDFGGSSTDLK